MWTVIATHAKWLLSVVCYLSATNSPTCEHSFKHRGTPEAKTTFNCPVCFQREEHTHELLVRAKIERGGGLCMYMRERMQCCVVAIWVCCVEKREMHSHVNPLIYRGLSSGRASILFLEVIIFVFLRFSSQNMALCIKLNSIYSA